MAINPKTMLTDELYFADKHYMSVSKFKRFLKCELDGLEEFGKPSEAMLIGSYVDHYISGTLEEFVADNPSIISSRGATKGKLKAGFKKAEEICEFLDNDPVFQQFLSGDKQTVMTGIIGDVPFKGKFDIYSKGVAINDLKIMATITDRSGNYYDFISTWGYHTQMAVYQELAYQNTQERLPVFICVATKEDPIDSAIIQIPQEVLDVALYDVQEKVKRFYDIWQGKVGPIGCGICKTCISARPKTKIMSIYDLQGGY